MSIFLIRYKCIKTRWFRKFESFSCFSNTYLVQYLPMSLRFSWFKGLLSCIGRNQSNSPSVSFPFFWGFFCWSCIYIYSNYLSLLKRKRKTVLLIQYTFSSYLEENASDSFCVIFQRNLYEEVEFTSFYR